MEIKYLKLIKTIAEEGNISNSAERLFLTQSALSHQLRDVEEHLGFKVFLRQRNKWQLTEEGKELYCLAKKVLDEIESGLSRISEIRDGSKGSIRISTECYSFYHGLPDFIQKMSLLYPEIEIELVIEATHNPVPKVVARELDMAIVTSRPSDESLEVIELFEDEVFALMHKEHSLCKKKCLTAQDFQTVHLIIHSFPLETVSVYEHFLKYDNITPSKVTAIPLTEVAIELVNANMGLTCFPKWALSSLKIPSELVLKQIGEAGLKRNHYLVFRKEDHSKKYYKDFISNVQEEFHHFNF